MSAPTIVQKLFKIDKLDPVPAPAPAVKTRPAAAPAPQQLTEPRLALLWPRPRHMTELGGAGVAVGPLLQLVVTQHPHTSVHTLVDVWEVYTEVGTHTGGCCSHDIAMCRTSRLSATASPSEQCRPRASAARGRAT